MLRQNGIGERPLVLVGHSRPSRSALALEEKGNREQAIERAQASLLIHRKIEDPFTPKIEAWLRERGIDP